MIPWYKPHFWGNEQKYVSEAINSTWISGGSYVDRLESTMAGTLDVDNVITTSNGTTLMLAFLALGIGPGDEVIVPGFCFVAPVNMVLAVGATPIFADIEPDTWLLSPQSVKQKIGRKTKAIVAVHTYGNICDMRALVGIAAENNLYLVEDVAEAAFSELAGKQAGTFGEFGTFSFQATKTITTGEGGAVSTGSDYLGARARVIRNHGMSTDRRYWHEVVGHNFRLGNLQAALGCAQLENLGEIIENKGAYKRYLNNLRDVGTIAAINNP